MHSSVDKLVTTGAEVGTSRGFKHSVVFTNLGAVLKGGACAQFMSRFCATFSTTKTYVYDLFVVALCTESTGPVTTTTKFKKNNNVMEAA